MIAYRLLEAQQPPELKDVPKPSAGAGELLVKVGGCGLCHTDIAIMGKTQAQLDEWHAKPPPFTLGHEIAGLVEAGIGFDGGLAEYIAVPARFAVHMGDLDPIVAAPLNPTVLVFSASACRSYRRKPPTGRNGLAPFTRSRSRGASRCV